MVSAVQEAEGAEDWQGMRDAISDWREERPGLEHEVGLELLW